MWDASKCVLCGDCLTKCQYVSYDKEKAVSEIEALMEGNEADILSKCITCCGCREYRPTSADPYDLILKAQERTGAFPIPAEVAGIFDLVSMIPGEVIPGDPDKPVLSLCVMESQLPEDIMESRLFEGMTVAKGGDALELIEYVDFMKRKRQQSVFKDLELASETSLGFWDNERDDEAWNNV